MSEHEEVLDAIDKISRMLEPENGSLSDTLARLERKIDLLAQIAGFELVECKDDYHRDRYWRDRRGDCPTCHSHDQILIARKI